MKPIASELVYLYDRFGTIQCFLGIERHITRQYSIMYTCVTLTLFPTNRYAYLNQHCPYQPYNLHMLQRVQKYVTVRICRSTYEYEQQWFRKIQPAQVSQSSVVLILLFFFSKRSCRFIERSIEARTG